MDNSVRNNQGVYFLKNGDKRLNCNENNSFNVSISRLTISWIFIIENKKIEPKIQT